MFEVLSSEIVKMPEGHPLDLPPSTKNKKVKPLPGSPDYQHGENHSFTGWTNVNSPNASQIQDTVRQGNLALAPNRPRETTAKTVSEKALNEQATIQDLKRKLWIDVTREKPYEESLRKYPKTMANRVSPPNRTSTALNPLRSPEFNVVPFYHVTSKSRESPLGYPTSPQLQAQQSRSSKEGTLHSILNTDAGLSTKNLKTPGLESLLDAPVTIKEFRLFKTSTGSLNPEKRAVTANKTRHNEPLGLTATMVSTVKGVKLEDPGKGKNLKLSKALSLWSHVASPVTVNAVINTQPNEAAEQRSHELLSVDMTELSSYAKVPGMPVPTKTLNLTPNAQRIAGSDIKYLVPLPHFKPTIKVKRPPDVEKSEAESKNYISKLEAVRMRVTSPINLYTKDWDTSNGFPRKASYETGKRSEPRRRPFEEAYGEHCRSVENLHVNISTKSDAKDSFENSGERKDSLYQKVMGRVTNGISNVVSNGESRSRTKETSLERQQGNMMSKTLGIPFMKVQGSIGIDGRGAKRHERLSRGITTPIESVKSSGKEDGENVLEPNKKREVKNFRLFGVRS